MISLCAVTAPGQATNSPQANLKAAAEKYIQAYMRKDYDACMGMMGGALISALGGRITVLDQFRRTEQALKQYQLTLEKMNADEPGPVVARGSNTLFAVVPEKHTYAGPDGSKYILNSYLLAVSEDNGQSWNMMEGSARVSDHIRNSDLVLYTVLKLPVRKIYLAENPQFNMLEKGGGFVTSPETLKYKKSFRKTNP